MLRMGNYKAFGTASEIWQEENTDRERKLINDLKAQHAKRSKYCS